MAISRQFDWAKIHQAIEEKTGKGGNFGRPDEHLYSIKLDETGKGSAIIRFLPPKEGEAMPWVERYNHGFQGANSWFIEDCPTTIGKPCPVCEYNNAHRSEYSDGKQNPRKRRVNYYSNILVIRDPACPENEGKVFRYRYGRSIFKMIMDKISPQSEIDTPVEIFDYYKGANFKLKVTSQSIPGYKKPVPNYQTSTFAEPGPIILNGEVATDEMIEKIDKQLYSLEELIKPDNFKSYDELSSKFAKAANVFVGVQPRAEAAAEPTPEPAPEPAPKAESAGMKDTDEESDDEFFAKLRSEG